MAVVELNSGSLLGVSDGVGLHSIRQWRCSTLAECYTLCQQLNDPTHHMPTIGTWWLAGAPFEDCVIVSVDVGPFTHQLAPGSTGGAINTLPDYDEYLVTAQYASLPNAGNTPSTFWPTYLTRPLIPNHACIWLRQRNSGQMLTMSAQNGEYVTDAGDFVMQLGENVSSSVLIPLTTYELIVDRLYPDQVPDFNQYIGAVNEDEFLGCYPETLLFEAAETDHSFAADGTYRYRCSIIVTERRIKMNSAKTIYGWNHEYVTVGENVADGPGFYRVKLHNGKPRYRLKPMLNMWVEGH